MKRLGTMPALAERSPYVLVLAGIASVQCGAAIATTLFASAGPGGAVFMRTAFGSVLLAAVWRPRVRGRTLRQLSVAALLGVVLGVMNLLFYHSIQLIPIGDAVTVEFLGPLLVATIGSRRPLDLVWVVLAALGVLALSHGTTSHLNGTGILLAALAGACWGLYIVVTSAVGRRFTNGEGLALAMAVAALITLPAGVIEGGGRLLDARVLGAGALIGLLSSAIPYAFEMEALRRLSKRSFGILMSLEPAVAALAGFLIVGQHLGTTDLAGIVMVVGASVGASSRGEVPRPAEV